MCKLIYSKQSQKDAKKLNRIGCRDKIEELLKIISNNPFQNPPFYEKLSGCIDTYSRRINSKHRLVYEIDGNEIKIIRMWTHYE